MDYHIRRVRVYSGMIIFAYVSVHLLNHSLGLISISAMDSFNRYVSAVIKTTLGTTILYSAFLGHIICGFISLFKRRSFKLPARDWAQIIFGILLPWVLLVHVIANGYSTRVENLNSSYALLVLATWIFDTKYILLYNVMLVAAWIHGVIGLTGVIRYFAFFQDNKTALIVFFWLVPILSMIGYISAGKEMAFNVSQDTAVVQKILENANFTDELGYAITNRSNFILNNYPLVMISLLAVLIGLYKLRKNKNIITIKYPHNREIRISKGTTILDASRENGIHHVSTCGGKGRCSTCRVRILSDLSSLPERNQIETDIATKLSLKRDVRLACQLRPTEHIEIRQLVSTDNLSITSLQRASLSGREQELVVMFIDLRNFTPISAKLLPYDTVYLLNEYFRTAGEAIEGVGGKIDKFIGDGIMAIFSQHKSLRENCLSALLASKRISHGMEALNLESEDDFNASLRIGIGIHAGTSIVGELGHGDAIAETAIGECVNVASRLEQLTKDEGCELIVSADLYDRSELTQKPLKRKEVTVRGKIDPITVCIFNEAKDLAI